MFPRSLAIACLAAGLFASCGKTPAPPAASTGTAPAQTQPVAKSPRIVSTVPAATLNLVLMGAADHIAGVTKYDRLYLPPDRRNLPVVGDYETMNYEQLVKLKPDVLVIQTLEARIDPKLREVAAAQQMELLNMRFDHVADIWSSVTALGRAAGMEAEAKLAIDAAKKDLADLAAMYRDQRHPKVLYMVTTNQLLVCGGNNFIDEMITAAGGENIGAKLGNNFIETSREAIIKLAPDVLLVGAMDEPMETANDPRLTQWLTFPVPAAANKRVYLVTDADSLMASVNIGKNVRALAALIHKGEPAPAAVGAPAGGMP
jgi:iron complex transport system substrate-binding protein